MAKARVIVCGLGPGGVGDISDSARSLITGETPVHLRTRRHPTAALAADHATSFDHLYDTGEDLAAVYERIADELIASARAAGTVVYAVPGSPLVLERSVRLLRERTEVETELRPAISFLDSVWACLGIDPVEESVRLVDGHTFAAQAAGERGPLLVAHTHAPWVLSDIKLAIDAGGEQTAVVLQRLGTPDEQVFEVAWPELDRVADPDHLTSLYLPDVAAPVAVELMRSVELMHRLRQDCPWDREQTHGSLRRHLLEEAHEVLEALDGVVAADEVPDSHPDAGSDAMFLLEEELGDLWFQVLFHAELAAETGFFDISDVARTMTDKLVARHPHVFEPGSGPVQDLGAQWEAQKQSEKQRASVMDGIPAGLPALALAEKILTKAERTGRVVDDDWLAAATPGSPSDDEALGRMLLATVDRARRAGLDPETSLRTAARRAETAFREVEHDPDGRWVLG